MSDLIDVNVTGRLMVLLKRHDLLDNRCLQIYQRAVSDAVRRRLSPGNGLAGIDPLLDEQLQLLDNALLQRISDASPALAATPAVVDGADAEAAETADAVAAETDAAAGRAGRDARHPSGYVPPVKSMEEKLQDARKPVQTLLREDCVRVGLIDAELADTLVFGMTGKTSEQAEQDIVERLRQILQDQVKAFIRKAKGGPWGDPRTQEELRKDIHAARSVRSILMLARQVTKEYRTWEREQHRGGILGLFSPRRKIVERR
ncbi:MAG: hypothetical protein QNJ91_16160 [Gammaproteobacteria bacterium]|nr:hypothetical protein [Gammaproteobacteria bacterium]